MAVEHLNVGNTLGVAFLGNIFAAIFYGATCHQILMYLKDSRKDSLPFRLVISALWVLNTLQIAFITHAQYYYLVENYANPQTLTVRGPWSSLAQIYAAASSNLIIRLIYCRRLWIITNHNIPLATVIVVTSLLGFGGGVAFATRVFAGDIQFADLSPISYLMYLSLGSGVMADITLAATLCLSLSGSRTEFKKMKMIIQTLMIYTINSCLLTTLCSTLCFITYAIWPKKFIYMAFFFCYSSLFFNSLLAMLNGRSSLQERSSRLSAYSLRTLTQDCQSLFTVTQKKVDTTAETQPKRHKEVETTV